jgi:hypothetical protein
VWRALCILSPLIVPLATIPARSRQRYHHMMRRSVLLSVSSLVLMAFAVAPSVANAKPTISFSPEVSSGGLGGLGSVNATLHVEGTEYGGFPPPVVGITLRLPSGTTLSPGDHSTCSQSTLEQTGPSGCPKTSTAGPVGKAHSIISFGSERVEEEATVEAFYGSGRGIEFFIDGHSPVSLEILMSATVASNVITMEVPLVSTVPGAPYASLTELELRLGETQPEEEASGLNSGLILTSECAEGHLAWSAAVFFDEGGANPPVPESVEAATKTGCPSAEEGPRKRFTQADKAKAEQEAAAKKKAEEEAAVRKRQQEEAELVQLRAEVKRLQQELGAAVKVEKAKITTKGVLVTIKTSEPGIVTISGRGLKKLDKTLAAGTSHVLIGLTKLGKAERREHKMIKVSVGLKVGGRSVSGSQEIKL